jgi:hypothetical protein
MDRNHRTNMRATAVHLQILHYRHYQRWHLSLLVLESLPNTMPTMVYSHRHLRGTNPTQHITLVRILVL